MKRTIQVQEEKDILVFLKENTDYSNKKLKSMIEHKQILVNERKPKLPYLLHPNDIVTINTDKVISTPFPIVYEDNKFLVVLKRSGLLTISGTKENEVTLYHQVFHYLHQKQEKVFVVHRLDKDTSGIVLFAKSEKVKNSLQEHWNDIVKSRKYVALIHGSIKKSGTIRNYLKEDKNTFVHSSKKDGKLAITHYQVLKEKDNISLVDITLETGRKNQIRVHMKELGSPLLGDKKYGIKDNIERLMLHAYELSFYYPPEEKNYQFRVEIPKDFLKMVS